MLNSKNEKEKNETERNIRIKHKSINYNFYRNLWETECVLQDTGISFHERKLDQSSP